MPIRFLKSGSPFRFGATMFVATAGLWFSSALYAQNQPSYQYDGMRQSAQTQQQNFNERNPRFNLPVSNQGQSQAGNFNNGGRQYNANPSNERYRGALNNQTATVTERINPGNLSNQSIQRLIQKPASAAQNSHYNQPQGSGVVDRVRTNPARTSDIMDRLTSPQSPRSSVATASHVEPARQMGTGVHQLASISMKSFEQKLIQQFGDQLQASTSDDGRFVRVALPVQSGQNAASMTMLVDRATGKLTYEGAAGLTAQWHQFVAQLDSKSPVVNADLQAEIIQTPNVQRVAYQQEAPVNQGTQVTDIPGLSGPVFISRDEFGNLTLSGTAEDVAIVKREIARLSKQAKAVQPKPENIFLENVRGNLIQERVQEIYDAIYSQISGPANITAIDTPNMLIVVGTPEAVNAVRNLVKTLDVKPVEGAQKDFRTFSLRNISSNDAANRLRRFFGQVTAAAGDNRIPESPVEIIPDFRSNQVTVRGSKAILVAADEFLRTIDVASVDDGAVNEVRIIQLKNALASEVAFVIQNAINGQQNGAGQAFAPQSTNQQQQQQNQNVDDTGGTQSQLRSAMLSFMTRNEKGELIKSGILFDVKITADANSNSLIVTGPASTIPLIEELVKQLDRIPDAEAQIKVYELVYSDAQTIFDMLSTLFSSQAQNAGGQQGGAAGGGGGGGLTNLPLQTGGGADGASLINLTFAIEPRSNAIIASGPARDLQVIEDLLNRLDARAINNNPAVVYRLSNAPALDVAEAINTYLEGRLDLINTDPRTANGVPAVNRTIIVTPEVVSNSLIVSALPEYLGEIENIIKSLDRRPPMIQVKVLIAEVNLDAVEEFGVELGIQDQLLFDRGTSIAADGSLSGIGFPFNTSTIPNANATGLESLPAQALSNLNVGRINSSLGYGGLVLSAGNESVSILLRALKDRQCVRVLSKPQIMTMENLQGRVSIGASVARISGTNTTNFGLTQNIVFQDVGVILEVTPRVSPDGLIVLSVNAENSSVGPEATGTAVGVGADGSIIRAQQILKTEATTTLSARSGQTVVFSGLITESKTHTERGAPIISDLPVIGPLFKFESDSSSRTELLIIMTPTLVTDDNDLATLNHEAMDRMHWCLSDVADVYGSTGYGGDVQMDNAVETYYPDADPTGMMQPYIQNSRLESPNQPSFGGGSQLYDDPAMQSVYEAPRQPAPAPAGSNTRSANLRRKVFNRR